MKPNPKNPKIVSADPDVDTAKIAEEAAEATQNVAGLTRTPSKGSRSYFVFGLLSVFALVLAIILAYYFFYASDLAQVTLDSGN